DRSRTLNHNTPMRFRKLRIAWSVAWGIAAALLIVLWVRSYWWADTIKFPTINSLLASSVPGRIRINVLDKKTNLGWPTGWVQVSKPVRPSPRPFQLGPAWNFQTNSRDVYLSVPHWFSVLLLAIFAGIPWTRWQLRFALRTLLIAMTLVAIVLGIGVY